MYYAPRGVYVSVAAIRRLRTSFHPPEPPCPVRGAPPLRSRRVRRGPALALETGYPLRREVDDGDDLAALQRLRLVVHGELRARSPDPDLGPEIGGQFYVGVSGFGEGFRFYHLAHPYVDLLEVFPSYSSHPMPFLWSISPRSPSSVRRLAWAVDVAG